MLNRLSRAYIIPSEKKRNTRTKGKYILHTQNTHTEPFQMQTPSMLSCYLNAFFQNMNSEYNQMKEYEFRFIYL